MDKYMHVLFSTNFIFFCIFTEKIWNYSIPALSLSYFTINSPYRLIKLQQIENVFSLRGKCFIKTQFLDKTQKMCKMYLFGNGWLLIQLKSFLESTIFIHPLSWAYFKEKKLANIFVLHFPAGTFGIGRQMERLFFYYCIIFSLSDNYATR